MSAYLSSISSSTLDPDKPSLFELVSETQLRELLDPSLRYILAGWAQRYPRYFLRIFNRFDELYSVLMLLVENHYLKEWGGSFTENFYGLKREKSFRFDLKLAAEAVPQMVHERTRIGTMDRWKSLLVLVLAPYIKRKGDQSYEAHVAEQSLRGRRPETAPNGVIAKVMWLLRKMFLKMWPWINFAYYGSFLAFYLAYAFDYSAYYTPFHYLLRLRMRRLTLVDHQVHAKMASRVGSPAPPTTTLSFFHPRILANSLTYALPTSIFFLQFLEWWNASPFASQLSASELSSLSLPPPEPISPGEDGVALPEDTRLCPICKQDMVDPTGCQTGYVFCYKCIHVWAEREGTCPITNCELIGGTNGLRRLRA